MAALKKIISYLWPVKIARAPGTVSPLLEVSWENGKKVLNAGTVNYSFGALHEVFQIALTKIKTEQEPPASVLILGFGAGSIASIIRDEMKLNSAITGVEADEAVIAIGRQHFGWAHWTDVDVVHARAEDFVRKGGLKFDLIAVDVFVEDKVPEACRSTAFISGLRQMLNKGGKVIFNEMPGSALGNGDDLAERFAEVFEVHEIISLQLGDEPNRVLAGYNF